MPAEPEAANTMSPSVRPRSVLAGDVPEDLGRRYFTDGRGGAGLGFYVDARVQTPAFRDRGRRMETTRSDPNAIRDMVAIAHHRGWKIVRVRGTADFRRETWLAARTAGLEIRGYRPSERDEQELKRRRTAEARRASRARADKAEQSKGIPREPATRERTSMRVVEAVVRALVVERSAQERILGTARKRLVSWLERGAEVRSLDFARNEGKASRERTH